MKQTVSHTTYHTTKSVFDKKGAANSELKRNLVQYGIMEEESEVVSSEDDDTRLKASKGQSPAKNAATPRAAPLCTKRHLCLSFYPIRRILSIQYINDGRY